MASNNEQELFLIAEKIDGTMLQLCGIETDFNKALEAAQKREAEQVSNRYPVCVACVDTGMISVTATIDVELGRRFLPWKQYPKPKHETKKQILNRGLHAACEYLNKDKDAHLAAPHAKWNIDPGKLLTALEAGGIKLD